MTGREDLVCHLRDMLLLAVAKGLGCNKVVFGHTSSSLAVQVISQMAKVRGAASNRFKCRAGKRRARGQQSGAGQRRAAAQGSGGNRCTLQLHCDAWQYQADVITWPALPRVPLRPPPVRLPLLCAVK